nr:endonuclease [Bacteroidota bacterium]
MKNIFLVSITVLWCLVGFSQIPPGYYDPAAGLGSEQLQQALHNIIDNHSSQGYGDLWNDFFDTDQKSNGKVWDIYSDVPGGNPPYEFTFFSDQCGNYSQEGDCYNREHSFPKSWFGGNVYPMYSDLFQVYPTDGYVNGKRSNYPYGEVGSATWTSQNGCKLGSNTYPGFSGTVFEPIDEYKGDLARTYFYMATRYLGEDNGWPGSPMVNGSQPETWALIMLHDWHSMDPVSTKETDRNNAIYDIQDNRNPFIDHPWFVDAIWFPTGIDDTRILQRSDFSVFPNPVADHLSIKVSSRIVAEYLEYSVTDQLGRKVLSGYFNGNETNTLDTEALQKGYYFIRISGDYTFSSTTITFVK